jgi:indole-3-glycerol phosphate synthase
MAEGILAEICRERAEDASRGRRERPASSLERAAGAPRSCFARPALLIAECKKASPSRGLIVRDYDPVALARAYERGGAGMVSVLTEPRHFLGSDAQLSAVRAAVGLPVLRKDFIVDEYQVREAWAIGADAILLIVAALERSRMAELAACARELGLSILVETRDEAEIEAAFQVAGGAAPGADPIASSDAIGVNARDLSDFSVDHGRAAILARLLARAPFSVAESGMKRPEDAAALRAAGYRGFLVGEALASSPDPEAAARSFRAALAPAPAENGVAAPPGKGAAS